MKRNLFVALALIMSISLTACHKQGPMERAGERVDEIGDNIAEGKNPLHKKGTLEKAGEAVDDAVDGRR